MKKKKITILARWAVLVVMLPLLPGCLFERVGKRVNRTRVNVPSVLPFMPQASPPTLALPADGSLWIPGISTNPFADDKAFRKGDVVLVRVVQKSTGTKKANLDTKRESSLSAKIKYLFGLESGLNALTAGAAPLAGAAAGAASGATGGDPNELIGSTTSRSFKGQGTSERSDALQATVSAIVIDVLNNGNLLVYGHQTVLLDNEASILTVQGIIRPTDIEADNSIDSTRLANADIQFTGSGAVTDPQQPGWGTRVFDWVWPF